MNQEHNGIVKKQEDNQREESRRYQKSGYSFIIFLLLFLLFLGILGSGIIFLYKELKYQIERRELIRDKLEENYKLQISERQEELERQTKEQLSKINNEREEKIQEWHLKLISEYEKQRKQYIEEYEKEMLKIKEQLLESEKSNNWYKDELLLRDKELSKRDIVILQQNSKIEALIKRNEELDKKLISTQKDLNIYKKLSEGIITDKDVSRLKQIDGED